MSSTIPDPQVVKFGDFELNLRSGELLQDGGRLVLPDQLFRLLAVLVRQRGALVTREDLCRELWPKDTYVDFELGLNAAVKRLRETLGDSASSPRFIETLPRRGYRFIAPIEDEATAPARRRAYRKTTTPTAIVIVIAVLIIVVTAVSRGLSRHPSLPMYTEITRLTNLGTVRLAAVSPDGSKIVYVRGEGVRESLWARIGEESDAVQLLEPVDGTFRTLTVAPDDLVYYTLLRPDRTPVELRRISIRGGAAERVLDAAGGVSFNPAGSLYAFVSTASVGLNESRIIITDAQTNASRVLAIRRAPHTFVKVKPAWSLDGRQLTVIAKDEGPVSHTELLVLDTADGHEREHVALNLATVTGIVWEPDDVGLVVSGREHRSSSQRLWRMHLPAATMEPLTHDVSDYSLAGLTRDGHGLIALRGDVAGTIWAAPVTSIAHARQVAVDSGDLRGLEGLAWAPDGHLLYAGSESGNVDIWSVDVRTNSRRRLTTDAAEDFHPSVSPDGRSVTFASTRSGSSAIWTMSMDGDGLRQLTQGPDSRPVFSADGRAVVFQHDTFDTVPFRLWRVSVDGGEPVQIGTNHTMRPAVSPDGRFIAHYWMTPEQWTLAITRVEGGLPVQTIPISASHLERVVRWSPDGRAVAFIDGAGGSSNIWVQPLDGSPARKLTDFTEGRLATFDWSRDGSMLAWMRVNEVRDVVIVDLGRRREQ